MTQHVWTNDEIEKWWDDYYTKKGIPQCDRTFPLTVKMPPLIAVECPSSDNLRQMAV